MADGKIYITITDQPISDNNNGIQSGSRANDGSSHWKNVKAPKEDTTTLGQWAQYQLFHTIKRSANEVLSYGIGNIGFFTGDYQQQRNVQSAVSVAQDIMSIGMSAIGGFSVGGVVGAIIGASITTINKGLTTAMSIYTEIEQVKRTNYAIDRLRDISGLNGLTNGSR